MFDTPQHWHFGDQPKIKWKHLRGVYWPTVLEASNRIMYRSMAEASHAGASGTEGTLKSITMRQQGTINFSFDYKASGSGFASIRLEKNDISIAGYTMIPIDTWHSASQSNIQVQFGDVITIVGKTFNTGDTEYARNFTVSYDVKIYKKNFNISLD